jgi:hypothetical protein
MFFEFLFTLRGALNEAPKNILLCQPRDYPDDFECQVFCRSGYIFLIVAGLFGIVICNEPSALPTQNDKLVQVQKAGTPAGWLLVFLI